MQHKRLLMTGGSGFIGSYLVPVLLDQGYEITVLTRNQEKTAKHFNNRVTVAGYDMEHLDPSDEQHGFDVVINLAGQGITNKRWSAEIKSQLRESRLQTTHKLVEYLQRSTNKPELFISGSAIGYYGLQRDHALNEQALDEQASADNSFASRLCSDWEYAAQPAEASGIRTCYLRTGIVLGNNGGALSKMLPAFKLGIGGPMGTGKQWMSWIHINDLVGIIITIINNTEINGVVNATAPNPVTNKVFSSTLGRVLKRPAFFPMQALVLKLLLGEMATELLLSGQRVVPKKMLDAGYKFQYTELENALRDLLLISVR